MTFILLAGFRLPRTSLNTLVENVISSFNIDFIYPLTLHIPGLTFLFDYHVQDKKVITSNIVALILTFGIIILLLSMCDSPRRYWLSLGVWLGGHFSWGLVLAIWVWQHEKTIYLGGNTNGYKRS